MRLLPGYRAWAGERDDEGHREFTIVHLVECEPEDGPASILRFSELPQPGDLWNFGNDTDLWAWCKFNATVTPELDKEKNRLFHVKQTFTTKPLRKCQDDSVEDPLLEPPKVSGNFTKFTQEATYDKNLLPILNSGWEMIRGPQNEWDETRATVKVERNVPILELGFHALMMNGVNAAPLWGLPARCIKFSGFSWERKYHGRCNIYYTITMEFDINFETHDRLLLDEGTRVINGQWDRTTGEWVKLAIGGGPAQPNALPPSPDPGNPQHFIRFTDRAGNPTKVIYDGRYDHIGEPYNPTPPPSTTSCTQCGSGAPLTWSVSGFSDSRFNIDLTYRTGSNCIWDGTITGGGTATLEYINNVGNEKWMYTISQAPTFNGSWATTPASWLCSGTNTMGQFGSAIAGAPATITFTSLTESEPRSIFIQKYQDRDFLLLAIPLIL